MNINNFTLSNIFISKFLFSPFLTISSQKSYKKYLISSSIISHFSNSFFYTIFPLFELKVINNLFFNFLKSSIYINTIVFDSKNINSKINQIDSSTDLFFLNTAFKNCHCSLTGGAFEFHSRNSSLLIKHCSFIHSYAESCGSFSYKGPNLLMVYSCCSYSKALSRMQFFKSDSLLKDSISVINLSTIDQASGRPNPGVSYCFSMSHNIINFFNNNLTRSLVRESRCLGSFTAYSLFYYKYNNNINCSGRNLLHFHINENGISNISNSLIYGCKSYHQRSESFLSYCGNIEILNFLIFKTQMLFLIEKKDNEFPSKLIFLNCITDIEKDKIQFLSKENIYFFNLTYNEKDHINLININYSNWECATFLPPTLTPTKSLSPTLNPTLPPFTPFPTYKLYIEPTQTFLSFTPIPLISKNDFIQIIILIILLFFSSIFIYLSIKKKYKRSNFENDDIILLSLEEKFVK